MQYFCHCSAGFSRIFGAWARAWHDFLCVFELFRDLLHDDTYVYRLFNDQVSFLFVLNNWRISIHQIRNDSQFILNFRGNKPNIDPQIFLGAYTGGVFWSIAMVFWLFSAQNLSQSITGPITAMLPGCFASLWSVFYFKEIQVKFVRTVIQSFISNKLIITKM